MCGGEVQVTRRFAVFNHGSMPRAAVLLSDRTRLSRSVSAAGVVLFNRRRDGVSQVHELAQVDDEIAPSGAVIPVVQDRETLMKLSGDVVPSGFLFKMHAVFGICGARSDGPLQRSLLAFGRRNLPFQVAPCSHLPDPTRPDFV